MATKHRNPADHNDHRPLTRDIIPQFKEAYFSTHNEQVPLTDDQLYRLIFELVHNMELSITYQYYSQMQIYEDLQHKIMQSIYNNAHKEQSTPAGGVQAGTSADSTPTPKAYTFSITYEQLQEFRADYTSLFNEDVGDARVDLAVVLPQLLGKFRSNYPAWLEDTALFKQLELALLCSLYGTAHDYAVRDISAMLTDELKNEIISAYKRSNSNYDKVAPFNLSMLVLAAMRIYPMHNAQYWFKSVTVDTIRACMDDIIKLMSTIASNNKDYIVKEEPADVKKAAIVVNGTEYSDIVAGLRETYKHYYGADIHDTDANIANLLDVYKAQIVPEHNRHISEPVGLRSFLPQIALTYYVQEHAEAKAAIEGALSSVLVSEIATKYTERYRVSVNVVEVAPDLLVDMLRLTSSQITGHPLYIQTAIKAAIPDLIRRINIEESNTHILSPYKVSVEEATQSDTVRKIVYPLEEITAAYEKAYYEPVALDDDIVMDICSRVCNANGELNQVPDSQLASTITGMYDKLFQAIASVQRGRPITAVPLTDELPDPQKVTGWGELYFKYAEVTGNPLVLSQKEISWALSSDANLSVSFIEAKCNGMEGQYLRDNLPKVISVLNAPNFDKFTKAEATYRSTYLGG